MIDHTPIYPDKTDCTDPLKKAVPVKPIILHYRVFKTSIFFTLIWFILALLSLYLIESNHYKINSIEFFTLILAAFTCLIMAIHSLDTYGGAFLYFNEDNLVIRHSMIRKVIIRYENIKTFNVNREEVEIIPNSGLSVFLNLAQLSFEDQAVCLKKLNEVQAASLNKLP